MTLRTLYHPPVPHPPTSSLSGSTLDRLRAIVGAEHVRIDEAARDTYGRDETERLHFPPAAVILPATTAEVAAILRLASSEDLPVTPRGAGTGLSGGALAVRGGLLLSIERMNRVLAIDSRDLVVEAEAGIVLGDLQRAVAEHGFFYPPDPGSRDVCLLAGTLGENAAGPRSCKYGATRRWVLGLEAVAMDGSIFRTGGRNRKDVAGYDLTQLLVGSEGTLAVVTTATLALIAQPTARLTLLLPFPDLEPAAAAVEALFRAGHAPAACELMDENALRAVAAVTELPSQLEGHAALMLLELDGDDPDRLLEEAERLDALATDLGAGEVIAAHEVSDQERLWAIRRCVGRAVKHRSIYKEADAVVPRSKLAELVRAARAVGARHSIEVICYGHAGDGNLHVNLLRGDLDDASWERRRDTAERELFERVVALGGSITGEHGIGWTQRAFLPLARDAVALRLMRGLKDTFDPQGLLNPGKVFLDA
ncbi:MAG: FAD-linked oxidase C-terminal domain-containing protein [Acidobacteriota bacterium]